MKFPYVDDPIGLADDIDSLGKAAAQAFGIVSSWLGDQELDRLISGDTILDGTRVYQIACIPCGNALRRAISEEESETKKLTDDEWIGMLHDGYRSEVPCRHFEQFEAFLKGVEEEGAYSLKILDEIGVHARLIEVGNS